MHLMLPAKAAKCILATQRVHFPKENVQLCKNAFLHHILRSKMFSITFDFVKCSASHFPKENVQQNKMLQMHLMLPLHFVYKMLESGKMHFGVHFLKENVQRTFDFVKCDAKQNVTNAFDAKMHLMQKCFFATRTFSFGKCSASHFPKENVQHHIFQRKMFSITFSKGKCSASHFPKENVQQSRMLESGQHKKHQTQHFCIKSVVLCFCFLFRRTFEMSLGCMR